MAKDLFIRKADGVAVVAAKMNAAARGITLADYFSQLVELHERAKAQASYSTDVRSLLDDVGLQEVTR